MRYYAWHVDIDNGGFVTHTSWNEPKWLPEFAEDLIEKGREGYDFFYNSSKENPNLYDVEITTPSGVVEKWSLTDNELERLALRFVHDYYFLDEERSKYIEALPTSFPDLAKEAMEKDIEVWRWWDRAKGIYRAELAVVKGG